ncbi:MAG: UbiA family prenyltransferase [Polyangiaceae bacterium]
MKKLILEQIPSLLRLHIVIVALLAQVVFAWLFTGHYSLVLVPFVAIDWFVINLVNRVTDLAEDVANNVPGADIAAARKRALEITCVVLFGSSLVVSHVWVSPNLTPIRLVVEVIGLFYNFRLLPSLGVLPTAAQAASSARTRFKEMYFFKNTMSALLFVLTCVGYPLALFRYAPVTGWGPVLVVVGFFVLFELSYEVLYDLRDLEGDRREGVPTYPVIHGERTSRRILDGLVGGAALALLAGFGLRVIGARELLMIGAPIAQRLFYGRRPTLTHRDCIVVTHMGSALLAFYLVGTALWARAGLPNNVYW